MTFIDGSSRSPSLFWAAADMCCIMPTKLVRRGPRFGVIGARRLSPPGETGSGNNCWRLERRRSSSPTAIDVDSWPPQLLLPCDDEKPVDGGGDGWGLDPEPKLRQITARPAPVMDIERPRDSEAMVERPIDVSIFW
jgi:hypothetical protein